MKSTTFRARILQYYRAHGRHELPWRKAISPYRILVSEMMLQQTQVSRVIPLYRTFLRTFPSFRALADASTADVLKAWQGLGYNRRALMLQRCAQEVVRNHRGRLPAEYDALRSLPGIGPYTAGAVLAFAFDIPHPVIETNIRRVYIHHFFPTSRNVADGRILPLVERDLAQATSPREWYSALMDYGSHLASTVENPNRRSRHHVRQAAFEGSLRQLRGRILKHLARPGSVRISALTALLRDERTPQAAMALEREGFVRTTRGSIRLAA